MYEASLCNSGQYASLFGLTPQIPTWKRVAGWRYRQRQEPEIKNLPHVLLAGEADRNQARKSQGCAALIRIRQLLKRYLKI